MKHELDNLTTEESYINTPDVNSPNFRTTMQCSSLTSQRSEENLRQKIQETEDKIASLMDQKRFVRGTRKEKSDLLSQTIEKNKEEIWKLEKQLEKLEINSNNITSAIKKQNQEKIEAFKTALKPLQDLVDMIQSSKSSLTANIEDIDNKLASLFSKEAEKLTQMSEKKQQQKETYEKISEILKSLEEVKRTNLWDYKEYIEDREKKDSLNKIKERKKLKIEKINEIDKVISDLHNQTEILQRDIDSINSSSLPSDSLGKNEADLLQLEEFLDLQCKNFNAPTISAIIKEMCMLENFPVNEVIFKEQFKLVEQKELELIEKAKHKQEFYDHKISELNKFIDEQEVEIYALMSVQQSDTQIEKNLKKSQKELEDLKEKYKRYILQHNQKIEIIRQWKTDNRNILLTSSSDTIPTDSNVTQELYSRIKPFVSNPEHWKAMESIIIRYFEKTVEREAMHEQILSQKQKESVLINEKTENLKQVRAIKTAKESERNQINSEFAKILAIEKKTLKDLENSKLEIESARKSIFKDQVQLSMEKNTNITRILKTYGEKAVKKILDKESSDIKAKIEAERAETKQALSLLYEEKIKWDKINESLLTEISETLKPELISIQNDINKLKANKSSLIKDFNSLSEAEEDAHSQLNLLAENKKIELVKVAKKVTKSHGGERSAKINSLYTVINQKESEIFTQESEIISMEGEMTSKEIAIDLEILKLKSTLRTLNASAPDLQKSLKISKKFEKPFKNIEIHNSDAIENAETHNKPEIKSIKSPKYSKESKNKTTASKFSVSSPLSIKINYIKEEQKDVDESSGIQDQSINIVKYQTAEESYSDVDSEIPCPKELQYRYEGADPKDKPFFDGILQLLEGTIVYKQFKTKSTQVFDPLEASVYPPESCGYSVRKLKINKHLSKIEIRQVGKSGVESSIMIEHIISVIVPGLTNEIIKAKAKALDDLQNSLEKREELNKAYRNMKLMGKVDYNSQAFICKAKETSLLPFFVNLKAGRVEFIAEGLSGLKSWVQGIKLLIKHKSELERLKFKIVTY
jgi:hypothetical protein